MPANPTLTISIDRTSLSLGALVLSASSIGASGLGVVSFAEPAIQSRNTYAPGSVVENGDVLLATSLQQTMLNFDVMAGKDVTETASRAAIAALRNAVLQTPSFSVTVTISDAPAEVWTCDPGSVVPTGGRSLTDLRYHGPVWAVSLPCYPVRA